MRKIAIASRKGGVGKTTTAVHLAAGLARAGSRTLLVDCDVQGHCKIHLGADPELGLGELIKGEASPERAAVEIRPELYLLAGVHCIGSPGRR